MIDDPLVALARQVLRDRTAALVAEACAWSVGLSDRPHHRMRSGRVVASGGTLGARAEAGLPLSGAEAGRLELSEARPGSFQDALNALTAEGTVHADRFDAEVLEPFVRQTCLLAAERARRTLPAAWAELLDDLGEDGTDLPAVVAAAEWETPLRIEAEHRVLAVLADVPLIEVEAEGLPLSTVRAAEAVTRAAVSRAAVTSEAVTREAVSNADDLAGAVFLAEAGLRAAGLAEPVPPDQAGRLLEVLLEAGVAPEEVPAVLTRLPVADATAERLVALLAADA